MFTKSRLVTAGFVCLSFLDSVSAERMFFFEVVPLGLSGYPSGINERGLVTVTTDSGGAYLTDGVSLALVEGAASVTAVNAGGAVIGQSNQIVGQPYIWRREAMQLLPVGSYGEVWDVNNRGVVAGQADGAATIWRDGLRISVLEHRAFSLSAAINNSGAVAGFIDDSELGLDGIQAFIWRENRGVQFLGPRTAALDINERGTVVGQAFTMAGVEVGFFFEPRHGLSHFELPETAVALTPYAINNSNWVVGSLMVPSDDEEQIPIPRAFLSFGAGPALLLDDYVRLLDGWTITFAYDINNRGQIAAVASHPFEGTMAVRLDPRGNLRSSAVQR